MARSDSSPRYDTPGKRRAGGIPFHRRHRKPLVVLLTVALLVLGTGTGYAYWLNSQLGNVDRIDTDAIKNRPDPDEGRALNILLLGSDQGEPQPGQPQNTTIADDATAATWPAGKYRSDTLMIVHVSADRRNVHLVSIPRDTYTTIYDAEGDPRSEEKVNAAFSDFGPAGAIATIEQLTDLRMRHLAILDWEGFKDISAAVGGVPVTIPSSFYDPQQEIQWEAGEQVLEGDEALDYVRTRYGLARGDFDRIARQQNFMRSLMKKMLERGTLTNPVKLSQTLGAVTRNLTVDDQWSAEGMRALALSLRGTQADEVTFLTAPVAGTEELPGVGSIVRLDEMKSAELFAALRDDTVDEYLEKYPEEALASEDQIN